ncbi:MAG: LacI family DNA-binding transcriptional regulator [Actinomycetota bacterium]
MKQVAALAGVGIKTVSRVINNENNVSGATRARVDAAIQQLNFHPDINAGSLRRADRRTLTLGLIVGNVANPFSGSVNRAVEDRAAERGIAVLAVSLDDDALREKALVGALLRRRVDALILTTVTNNQAYLMPEIAHGTPFVFVDREPVGVEADVVVSDNAHGASIATEHLLSRGHRRIAFIGDRSDIQTSRERRRGFFEALGRAGVVTDEVIAIDGIDDEEAARSTVTALLDLANPPTAIFSGQNLITVGTLRALRDRNRHRSTALIGFDDFLLADLLDPAVTVIAQDPSAIGHVAADRAFARLDGDPGPFVTTVIPTRLIVRGSGEILPE